MEDEFDDQNLSLLLMVLLPLKFKMTDIKKFNLTGFPTAHLKMCIGALQLKLMAQLFHQAFSGAILR